MERDSVEQIHIAWSKTKVVDGQRWPRGSECYRCFDVRRRYFEQIPQEKLNDARKQCTELDERFLVLRRDRASGENKHKNEEKIDVARYVEKIKSKYKDRFEEGTFHRLWSFARMRRLPYKEGEAGQEAALTRYVEETLGLTVVEDEDGNRGVEILDHAEGQYRFKRGKRTEIADKRQEKLEDKLLAKERFDVLSSKMGENLSMVGHMPGRPSASDEKSELHLTVDDDAASVASSMHSSKCVVSTTSPGPAASDATTVPGVPASVRGGGGSVALTRANSSASLGQHATEQKEGVGAPGADAAAGAKKRRKTSHEFVMETAVTLLKKTEFDMAWEKHWDGKCRKREFESLTGRLTGHGRRCGAILGNERAADLSQQCYDMVQVLDNRQRCFEKIRLNFTDSVMTELSDSDRQVLLDGPSTLVTNILTMQTQMMIDRSPSDLVHVDVFMSVLPMKQESGPGKGIGLWLVNCEGTLIEQAQRGLTLVFAEKLWKGLDSSVIVGALKRVREKLPVESLTLDDVDTQKKECLGCGWFPQAWVDLKCIAVLGSVLEKLSPGCADLPRALRTECVEMVRNSKKISPRLKMSCKKMNGAHVQHGRDAWDMAVKVHAECQEQVALGDQGTLDMMSKLVTRLQLATVWESAYDVVVDICNDHHEQVLKFGRVFGASLPDAGDGASPGLVAQSFAKELGRSIDLVLIGCDYLAPCWPHILVDHGRSGDQAQKESTEESKKPEYEAMGIVNCMQWFVGALEVLLSFSDTDRGEELLMEAKLRAEVALLAHDAFAAYLETTDVVNVIHQLSEAWEKQLAIKAKLGVQSAESKSPIMEFIEKAATKGCYATAIARFVAEMVGQGGGTLACAVRECHVKEELLPKELEIILKAAGVLDRLAGSAARIRDGRLVGGLLELTTMLSEASDVQSSDSSLLSRRPDFEENHDTVMKEWRSTFNHHLQKYQDMTVFSQFQEKYTDVLEAVGNWSFAKCPYLRGNSTPEADAVAKKIEQLLVQFSTWRVVTERVGQYCGWASEEQQGSVKAVVETMDAKQNTIDSVATLLGAMVLTTVLLKYEEQPGAEQKAGVQAALKYVVTILKVKEEVFSKLLREKLQAALSAASEEPGAASSGRAEASTQQVPQAPKKRRLTKMPQK